MNGSAEYSSSGIHAAASISSACGTSALCPASGLQRIRSYLGAQNGMRTLGRLYAAGQKCSRCIACFQVSALAQLTMRNTTHAQHSGQVQPARLNMVAQRLSETCTNHPLKQPPKRHAQSRHTEVQI